MNQIESRSIETIQEEKLQDTKGTQKQEQKIKIALSLGYPSYYFYNKRCNMLL